MLGDNVKILVFEHTSANHPCLQCANIDQAQIETSPSEKDLDHATIVVSILQSMTPHSFISILPPLELPIGNHSLLETIKKSRLINQSLGFQDWKEAVQYKEKIKTILTLGVPKLIIQSAGNSGRSLSDSYAPYPKSKEDPQGTWVRKQGLYTEWARAADHRALREYLETPEIQESMIVVGSVDSNYQRSSFSNYPGSQKIIQENFLCALGREVGAMRYQSFEYVKGTSVSTPIVTGAAALLMSAYPHLTHLEIKEALLESADRDFIIDHGDRSLTIIYDPQDPVPSIEHLERKGYRVTLQVFDPQEYGKGILNLRNAKEYIKLKESNPNHDPTVLRAQMRAELLKEKETAVIKIKKVVKYLQRRKPIMPPSQRP